jgi:nitrile hydratase
MDDTPPHDHAPHHHAMHDLGGTDHQPFLISEHEPNAFDKDVDALVNLLALQECGLVRPDERRRGIEELAPEIYFQVSYYERWLLGVTDILIEKGLLTEDEIAREIARLAAAEAEEAP